MKDQQSNIKSTFWIGIILLFVFLSCESEVEKKAREEQRLQDETELRIANYVSVLEKNCQNRVMEEAVRIADSLLVLEARLASDSLFKPLRPEKPETRILLDTVPIKPFIIKPKRDTDTIHQ